MTRLARTPCTILTGFLGAGKTTLIRHLLSQAGGRRLAVIVNEFGDVGVDGDLIGACAIPECPADRIIELTNGCLCCTVADDFVPALEALLDRPDPPEAILIETSGLALPKPLVKAFGWPGIKSRVTVDGVIAVVDAEAVAAGRFATDPARLARQRAADDAADHDTPVQEVFEDQLACADLIILNKTDLVDEAALDAAAAVVQAELPRPARILRARQGQVDPRVLLGLAAAAEDDLAARPTHHDTEADHDHDDFTSFVIDLPPPATVDGLIARLTTAADRFGILRVKGFIDLPDKPMRLTVQGVGSRFNHVFDRPWRAGERRASRLVVIGEQGLDRDAVVAALAGA